LFCFCLCSEKGEDFPYMFHTDSLNPS
jgi:hypothetical protein